MLSSKKQAVSGKNKKKCKYLVQPFQIALAELWHLLPSLSQYLTPQKAGRVQYTHLSAALLTAGLMNFPGKDVLAPTLSR